VAAFDPPDKIGSCTDLGAPKRTTGSRFAPWQVRQIEHYIDSNLAAQVTVKALAALLEFSDSHFYRTFRRTFGTSTRTWIAGRRIAVAQTLMQSSRTPLSEIALRCGMSDQAHFTRAFRRIVGQTPQSWRQTRRNADLDPARGLRWSRTGSGNPLPPNGGLLSLEGPAHTPERD
jgi:AraC-like DNA-binding protein